jgi:hypothetical protein
VNSASPAKGIRYIKLSPDRHPNVIGGQFSWLAGMAPLASTSMAPLVPTRRRRGFFVQIQNQDGVKKKGRQGTRPGPEEQYTEWVGVYVSEGDSKCTRAFWDSQYLLSFWRLEPLVRSHKTE